MLAAENRVILVSGANRGIGKAIATELSRQGYSLSLGARDPSTISATADAKTMTHRWEATSKTDSADWVKATLDKFGQIDGIVLNAGVMFPVGIENGTDDELDQMLAVNFKGPLNLIRAAYPALKASGHGRVINIVSLAGKRVLRPDNLGYSASKFASLALTHAVRQDGWEHGIRCTAVCPGLVDTDMIAQVTPPAGQYKITPEAIAATTAYALSLPNEAAVAEILVNSRLESAM